MQSGSRWDKYKVSDKWSKYAVTPDTTTPPVPSETIAPEATPRALSPKEQVSQAFNAPSQAFNQSMSEFKGGNYPAGLLDLGNTAWRGLGMPFNVAAAGYRAVPGVGEFIAQTIEAPPKIIEAGLYDLPRAILKPIVSVLPQGVQNLGQSPENAAQTARAAEEFSRGGTQILGGALVGGLANAPKGLGGIETPSPITQGLDVIGKNLEQRRIAKSAAEIKHAAPPTVKELHYDEALKRAQPYIAEQVRDLPIQKGDVSSIRQAHEVIVNAKQKLWNEKIAPQVERHADVPINGKSVADAIRNSISEYTKNHEPSTASRIEDYASTFDKQIPLAEANKYITELNARTNAYQKATPVEQATMETAHPNIKAEAAAVESLRENVYGTLSKFNEKGVAELRKDYGSLIQIGKAIERKIVPGERQTPAPLGRFGTPIGAGMVGEAVYAGMKYAPKALAFGGIMAAIREAMIRRGKINPTIKRGFNRLGKTSLTPREIISPPPSFGTSEVMTKQPTIEELSNLKMTDIPPEKFNEVMSYRMAKDRSRAVSDVENSPHYSAVKPILDEAGMRIESIKDMGGVPTVEFTDPNSMYTTTLPVSEMTVENIKAKVASKIKQEPSAKITADDLTAYRQYISGGGNLNISEWKKSLGR